MMSASTRKSLVIKLTSSYFAIYSFSYLLHAHKMWLFCCYVMELMGLRCKSARKLKKFDFVNQSRKMVLTNFQCSQVSSETRQLKLIVRVFRKNMLKLITGSKTPRKITYWLTFLFSPKHCFYTLMNMD